MSAKSKRLKRTRRLVGREAAPKQRLVSAVISLGILTTFLLSAAATASVVLEGRRSISLVATNSPSASPANLKWDFENKLAAIDTDNDGIDDISYTYDALGRRIGRDDGTLQTVFVHQDEQVVADYASAAAPTAPEHTYVYGDYIDEPVVRVGSEGKRYFHRNQQYSVTALTDETGSVTEQYAYDAYGSPTILDGNGSAMTVSAEANRYLYTGREWDEDSGLYYYRARQYDPKAGRFCSRDPIGYEDGGNLFSNYFLITYLDPTGHSWQVGPNYPVGNPAGGPVLEAEPIFDWPNPDEEQTGDEKCQCQALIGNRMRPRSPSIGIFPPEAGTPFVHCTIGEKTMVRYESICVAPPDETPKDDCGEKDVEQCTGTCYEYVEYECKPRGRIGSRARNPEITTMFSPSRNMRGKCE